MTKETENSGLQVLWDRKFPQYVGTYFAVGFGALQFLEFLSKRYDLSGNFVDKYLLVWFALLPALLILIYFKGKLNPSTTKGVLKWPKFAVIGNVVVAFLLGGILFNGNSEAAASEGEIVQLTSEEGKAIEAVIPALHKVKTVACFQFENRTGDETLDWWSTGFSNLLELDLNQRPEFYAVSQYQLHVYYDRLGLEGFKLPNVGMQREIAQKSRSDYFTTISYTIENNQFVLKGDLLSSRDSKSVLKLSAANEDPYVAIDEIKQQIYDNIPDPFDQVKDEMNLPVSALISSNTDALKNITLAMITLMKNPTKGVEEVKEFGAKAIALDPTCSMCSYIVGYAYYLQGNLAEAKTHVKTAVKYCTSLPERMQFDTKALLYGLENNTEAAIKLQELRMKMFPYEFVAYQTLLPIYMVNYGIDSAKVLMRKAINNGNIEKGLLALYDLQLQNEEYLEAEKTLNQFSKEFPDREQDRMKYADIFEKQGKIEEAKKILLEEETMDPLKTSIQIDLAYLDFKNVDITKANERVDKGLQQATTLSDSLSFLWIKGFFLRKSGQIGKSIKLFQEYEALGARQAPVAAMIQRTFNTNIELYQSIGQPEGVNKVIAKFEKYLPETVPAYRCVATTNLVERSYGDVAKDTYLACRDEYLKMGEGFGEYFDILIAYKAKDYEKCLKILNQDNGKLKSIFDTRRYFLVNVYTKAGKIDLAKQLLKKTIEQKTEDPIYYYQMATLLETENKKEAKEYLNTALKFWANADEDYIPLLRAKELSARLAIYNSDES